MINTSKVITSIKMDLGLYGLSLPFGDTDEVIMDVIREKTLPVFNELQPHRMSVPLDIRTMRCLKNSYNESVYQIPDVFGDRELLYVFNVSPRITGMGGYAGTYGSVSSVQELMMTQVNADVMSYLEPPFTFKFTRPNKLHLFNMETVYGNIELEVGLEHAENLTTITKSSYTSFLELATLDVKLFLYNQLKHYNEIQTAHGTISLKIDDWSNADSERKDLLARWRDTYHFEVPQVFII